jgi:hypothetical protein
MKPEITAAVVMFLCLFGALAAQSGGGRQVGVASQSNSSRWRNALLCCAALVVAGAVCILYLR